MAGWLTDGMTAYAPATSNPNLAGNGLLPVDTQTSLGAQPQTLAATTFAIAAFASTLVHNTASATAGAATLNTRAGLITSDALTTAAGATYTLTVTDSACTTTSVIDCYVHSGSNTTVGAYISSVTPAAGSFVIVVTNGGTAALNGTLLIAFRF
jgi:hypothetical protein